MREIIEATTSQATGLLQTAPAHIREAVLKSNAPLKGLVLANELVAVWTVTRSSRWPSRAQLAAYLKPGYEYGRLYGRLITDDIWSCVARDEMLYFSDMMPETEFTNYLRQEENFVPWYYRQQSAVDPAYDPPLNQVYSGRVLTYSQMLMRPHMVSEFATKAYRRSLSYRGEHFESASVSAIFSQLSHLQLHDAPVALVDGSRITAFVLSRETGPGEATMMLTDADEPTMLDILLPYTVSYLKQRYTTVLAITGTQDDSTRRMARLLPLKQAPVLTTYMGLRPARLMEPTGE